MHRLRLVYMLIAGIMVAGFFVQTGCKKEEGTPSAEKGSTPAKSTMSNDEMVARGKYLVLVGGCNDCHTPKLMTPQGPVPDTTRTLAGHWADEKLPSIDTTEITPGKWYLGSSGLTAWVGPWGISFASNLTPDSATGTGGWSDDMFIKVWKTGQYIGAGGGRPIMPPMPWQAIGMMTDEDLQSIIAYLRSIPAIKNAVPQYVPPPMIASMGASAK